MCRIFEGPGWNYTIKPYKFSYTIGEGDEQTSLSSSAFLLAHIRGCLAARLPRLVDRNEAREFLPAVSSRVLEDRALVFRSIGVALHGLLSETATNLGEPFVTVNFGVSDCRLLLSCFVSDCRLLLSCFVSVWFDLDNEGDMGSAVAYARAVLANSIVSLNPIRRLNASIKIGALLR